MAEKKKSKLGAKAIFARILAVILVTPSVELQAFLDLRHIF